MMEREVALLRGTIKESFELGYDGSADLTAIYESMVRNVRD